MWNGQFALRRYVHSFVQSGRRADTSWSLGNAASLGRRARRGRTGSCASGSCTAGFRDMERNDFVFVPWLAVQKFRGPYPFPFFACFSFLFSQILIPFRTFRKCVLLLSLNGIQISSDSAPARSFVRGARSRKNLGWGFGFRVALVSRKPVGTGRGRCRPRFRGRGQARARRVRRPAAIGSARTEELSRGRARRL